MVTRVSVILVCVSMQKWSSANVVAEGVVRRVAVQVFQRICQRHGVHLFEDYSEGDVQPDAIYRRQCGLTTYNLHMKSSMTLTKF